MILSGKVITVMALNNFHHRLQQKPAMVEKAWTNYSPQKREQGVVPLVKCLLYKHKDLSSIPRTHIKGLGLGELRGKEDFLHHLEDWNLDAGAHTASQALHVSVSSQL